MSNSNLGFHQDNLITKQICFVTFPLFFVFKFSWKLLISESKSYSERDHKLLRRYLLWQCHTLIVKNWNMFFGLKFGVWYQIFTPSLLDESLGLWRSFALCTIENLLCPSCFRWMAIISPFQICIRKVRYCVHWQVNSANNQQSEKFLSFRHYRTSAIV